MPSSTYGHVATCNNRGANRPTPSAPAVATSADRHQASHVRSAAMTVCTAPGAAAPVAGAVGSGGSDIWRFNHLRGSGLRAFRRGAEAPSIDHEFSRVPGLESWTAYRPGATLAFAEIDRGQE